MLSDLDGRPFVPIVDAPDEALVLEAGASRLGRRVDAPFTRGREFSDGSLVDEVGDGRFEGTSGSERPYGGSLSLDRDLRGGIGEGLGGHVARRSVELEVEDGCRSGRSRRRQSCFN